jgi:tRNA-uridine 2-sulfurtransferase
MEVYRADSMARKQKIGHWIFGTGHADPGHVERNQLIVGWDDPTSDGLCASDCVVGSVSLLLETFDRPTRCEAQPRYRCKSEPVEVTPREDGKLDVHFLKPQRALSPGQICAFYDGGRLLGGGVFESVV